MEAVRGWVWIFSGIAHSWQDPDEDKDSRWESRQDLWRNFFLTGSWWENTQVGKT